MNYERKMAFVAANGGEVDGNGNGTGNSQVGGQPGRTQTGPQKLVIHSLPSHLSLLIRVFEQLVERYQVEIIRVFEQLVERYQVGIVRVFEQLVERYQVGFLNSWWSDIR